MPDGHLNSCKACRRKWDNEYKKENKDLLYKQTKEWKQINANKVSEYRKLHYTLNKEHQIESFKKWRDVNRERHALTKTTNNAKRRATKRSATPWWSNLSAIKEIYRAARELTLLTGIQFHVDHIVPLIHEDVQGLHVPANLRIVPYYENCSKGNKLIEDIVCSL